jgi:hypothetical protein
LSGAKSQIHSNANVGRARDELFSHIHRCGVLQATGEQQVEWMDDTVGYLGERFPELADEQIEELRTIGLRFCAPVIAYGADDDEETSSADDAHGVEEATAAEAAA